MSPIKPEETIRSESIYQGRAVNLRKDTVVTGTGEHTEREVVEHAPVVVMAPLMDAGKLLMVRQYRKPVERELLELPAGGVEPGESLTHAVRREMIEETGYAPGAVEPMVTILPSPGISNEVMHIFRVSSLEPRGGPEELTDQLEVEVVTVADAVDMVWAGGISDAKSIIGVLMLESASQHNDLRDGG